MYIHVHILNITQDSVSYNLSKIIFCTEEKKNEKCDLHSRIPTIKSLHTFLVLFLHKLYNCTCYDQRSLIVC